MEVECAGRDKVSVVLCLARQVGAMLMCWDRGPAAIREMKEASFKVREMKKHEAYWN